MPPAVAAATTPLPSRRSRRTLWRVLGFATLHFLALKTADFLVFFLSHLPPVVFNIDGVINLALVGFRILYFPRPQLRLLWPGEHTPGWVNVATAIAASLVWGAVITTLLAAHARRAKRNG
ncbi:hypothetical protein LBMAG56_16210 [Verrucomicrobiota bacterium]|nr:hypothetical protein LBMAG56_16210 [Verrucomicrobiota bacterium]